MAERLDLGEPLRMASTAPTPVRRFGRRSTAEEVTSGVDLSGRTLLITGVNSGLGLESMRVLTARGAHVIGAARTLEKAQKACAQVKGATTPVACELSDLASVAACATEVAGLAPRLDAILCNAGIMALPKLEQRYGLELQFVTNHLGHFALVNGLLENVKAAPQGRVVWVSSMAHIQAPLWRGIDFDNLSGERGYSGWTFYGHSKLANLLTSNELGRRLEGTPATSNALHPGIIKTNLGRHMEGGFSSFVDLFAAPFQRSVPEGAATQCLLVAHPEVAGVSGAYYADCKPSWSSPHGRNAELARRLWDVSLELVATHT